MLDIEIFHIDENIYEGNNKIGTVPHLSLGSYTPLTPEEKNALQKATTSLSDSDISFFAPILEEIGKKFYTINLRVELVKAKHPTVKQLIRNQLQKLSSTDNKTLTQLHQEKKGLKALITSRFKPEEQVMIMMKLKEHHEQQKKNHTVSPLQDELFARGIAECVQAIRDLPKDQKSPLITNLCFSSTHRHYPVTYSR